MTLSRILVVCLGNICRSPLGEHALKHALKDYSITVESAGTSNWHEGGRYDARSIKAGKKLGWPMTGTSRPVRADDFSKFDLLLAMDQDNYATLQKMCPKDIHYKIKMFREWDPVNDGSLDVEDPYYSASRNAFDDVAQQCYRVAKQFAATINE
ncbi:hypothetical protein GEMRC1_010891 [Eukaryota sp. GEM-RC1]